MIATASARAVSKHFGATQALDGVDFEVLPDQIHALVGENGAGKSTLVRVLGGVHRPDQGTVEVDGVVELRKSCKIRAGSNVVVGDVAIDVVA